MSKVLIIGAGGVGNVVAKKCAQVPAVFSELIIASRTKSKCDKIAAQIDSIPVTTDVVDADYAENVIAILEKYRPFMVINVALPYQDLAIMDACLVCGVHYLDTANYEPKDEAKFEYSWQWAYQERFKAKGLMALLGCGFDPGVTGVFTAYANKHHFDEMHYLDIVDCNAGDHGQPFATNFNLEINIREITQNGRFWENGQWVETMPMEIHKAINYPSIGARESYLLYHEELESLTKNFPSLKRARFWMTFSEAYLKHLEVLGNVGLTSIEPVLYEGKEIIPLQFLQALLPEPSSLGENYTGETSIGCHIKGMAKGEERNYYIYNNCNHAKVYEEVGAQAVAYTTGVPAMIGAMMMLKGTWMQAGVWNVEQLDPDPFMEQLTVHGLPWHELLDDEYAF